MYFTGTAISCHNALDLSVNRKKKCKQYGSRVPLRKKTMKNLKQKKLIFAFEFCFISTASEIQNKYQYMPGVTRLGSMITLQTFFNKSLNII